MGRSAAPRSRLRRRAHARGKLLHGERLHQVVVRTQLERAHAVLLAAARAHDDNRGADALLARGFDDLPAVKLGKHQVEHANLRPLVAQTRQRSPAVAHPDRIEAGGAQVARHPIRDDLVVLDDQDLRHPPHLPGRTAVHGFAHGEQVVTDP